MANEVATAIHTAVDATVDNCVEALHQVTAENIPAAETAVADATAHHDAGYTAADTTPPDTGGDVWATGDSNCY